MSANPKGAEPTKSPLEAFQHQLTLYMPEISRVLPQGITPERFVQVCMNAVLGNADLLDAVTQHPSARRTFFAEALKCATDGLVPDGREAAFTTFNVKDVGKVVKYMPMIQGILKKVRNSGELVDITAQVIYERDEFEQVLGDDERIVHRPPKLGQERGKPVGAYAIAKTSKEGVYREVMTEAQLQAVANVSRAKDKGPWAGPFADEMRRKTVLRRLSKRLPMSSDVAGVFARDDDLYDFGTPAAANEPAGGHQEPASGGGKAQAAKTREAMGLPAPGASTPAPSGTPAPAGNEGQQQEPPPGHPAAAGGSPQPGDDGII